MSHFLNYPYVPLCLSHFDLCLPTSGNADKLPPWWPRDCCLSSYDIAASSHIPCVGFLAESSEVVDAVIPSHLCHYLGPKILPKVCSLNSLHPIVWPPSYSFPFLTFRDFNDNAVPVWDLWFDRAFLGVEGRCVNDRSGVDHISEILQTLHCSRSSVGNRSRCERWLFSVKLADDTNHLIHLLIRDTVKDCLLFVPYNYNLPCNEWCWVGILFVLSFMRQCWMYHWLEQPHVWLLYCVLHMTWLSQLLRYVDSLTVQQLQYSMVPWYTRVPWYTNRKTSSIVSQSLRTLEGLV